MAKTLTGIVSSDRADKTIVVTVRTRKTHPIYKKQYTVSTKFMAHDETNEAKIGDTVVIAETRPISARKRFILQNIAERATIRHEEPVETEKSKDSKKTAKEELPVETVVETKPKRTTKAKGDES